MDHDPDKPSSSKDAPADPAAGGAPQYMTVGDGTISASASALMAQLEQDSGYGGSIADTASVAGPSGLPAWHPSNTHDIGTPSSRAATPGIPSTGTAEHDRRVLASQIHQLHYHHNRTALARAINRTLAMLDDLKRHNSDWPAHYPMVQQTDERPPSRPGLQHSQTTTHLTTDDINPSSSVPRPMPPRRAETSLVGSAGESSSAEAERQLHQPPAPSLITPQRDFSTLKLDLKLQGLSQSEITPSMDRRTMASLLDVRINQTMRHMHVLQTRIEDASSKVLVTGDLNAGKSTFCNALLRRKVLPEDQQPCTGIFCEVVDARENGGVEEVHAIRHGAVYDRKDERTYDVFGLDDLEQIVIDADTYKSCKVYVRDIRSIDESLLNNGVVDISLIDAPGLNADSLKTTEIFAKNEEIDVVVFVVSAANHFTLSARDFLWDAAQEKAYIFIVVNGYDNIRDKERCQRTILDQVAKLSPHTFKESSELVHFVSSNQIPLVPAIPGGGPGGSGGGGGGGSGSSSEPFKNPSQDDDDDDDDRVKKDGSPGLKPDSGKGKEKENLEDFENLEGALRRFVLEKRARSKLAPARTFLINVLSDLHYLAETNQRIAAEELESLRRELDALIPEHERSERARDEVSDQVEGTIESSVDAVYRETRAALTEIISSVADADLGVEYQGLLGAFQYAEDIKDAILTRVSAGVAACEDAARMQATDGVRSIATLGKKHLGDAQFDIAFRSDKMFQGKKRARQASPSVEFWDFFDLGTVFERQEKVAGGGMALTVVGVLGGRLVGGVGWMDGVFGAARVMGASNVRRMIVPGLIATVCLATAYVLHSIPTTLPRRLSRRIASDLADMDYTHANSARISAKVGQVLRVPASKLRLDLQNSVESLRKRREEMTKTKSGTEVARKYFSNLVRDSTEARRGVEAVDLESNGPSAVGTLEQSAVL